MITITMPIFLFGALVGLGVYFVMYTIIMALSLGQNNVETATLTLTGVYKWMFWFIICGIIFCTAAFLYSPRFN